MMHQILRTGIFESEMLEISDKNSRLFHWIAQLILTAHNFLLQSACA